MGAKRRTKKLIYSATTNLNGVEIMSRAKQVNRVIFIVLPFVGMLTFLYLPRHEQDRIRSEHINSLLEQGAISSSGVMYEARYSYKNKDGHIETITVVLPSQNPNLPIDYLRAETIEEQIYEQIRESASISNIVLPENFEDNVLIAAILE